MCVGCSISALRKIETDERRPSRQLADLLASCLEIPPEYQKLFIEAARGLGPVDRLRGLDPRSDITISLNSTRSTAPNWNLPHALTPFLGREAEQKKLADLISDPGCRLLTFVGPGGIGKTRLAIEVACEVYGRFGDGVYFTSLVGVSDPEFIVPAIAQSVNLNFSGPLEPQKQLINYLENKQTLLLLDNFEHLLGGVNLIVDLLSGSQGVKLLVTSRERLELRGEWVFEVEGLPIPSSDQEERVDTYSAVQIFYQRACRARFNFQLSESNIPYIVKICRLAEGMPLAIELAATWITMLSCREIAGEIERGLDILTTTLKDVPDRQRSMRAVFDHSWQLLTDEERQSLRRLSVFRGGFQREAAQVVAGADISLLSNLIAKSFIRRSSKGRFTIHELVRQYLALRLGEDPDEMKAARDAHSTYYTDFIARLEGELKGNEQLSTMPVLDDEINNIRSAWRWAVRHGSAQSIQKPIRTLWYYFDIRGWFQEAEQSFNWAAEELERIVAEKDHTDETLATLIAYIRAEQGWFCLRSGKFEESDQLVQSNLEKLRAAGAYIELVDALQHAGALDRLMGNYTRSGARFEEMLQFAIQTNDLWNAAIAEGNIGLAAQALGDYEQARVRMGKTVDSFRMLGEKRMLSVALHFLGGTSCMLHDYDRAQIYLLESLALSRSIGDRWIESISLRELGNVTREIGTAEDAAPLFRESLALAKELGEHWSILQALNALGETMIALEDFPSACETFFEALAMAWEMQDLPDVLASLGGLARLSCQQYSKEMEELDALVISLIILNHPKATQKTIDEARRLNSELTAQLDTAQVKAAQNRAQSIALETLVPNIISKLKLESASLP